MKSRGLALAAAAALMAGALPAQMTTPANARVVSATNAGQVPSGAIAQPTPAAAATRRMLFSATGAFDHSYRKRPTRKVAWDKRDARKARRRAR